MKLKEIKEAIRFNCGCEYCGKTKMEWTFNQTINAVKEEIINLKKQMAINPREEQIFDVLLEEIESARDNSPKEQERKVGLATLDSAKLTPADNVSEKPDICKCGLPEKAHPVVSDTHKNVKYLCEKFVAKEKEA